MESLFFNAFKKLHLHLGIIKFMKSSLRNIKDIGKILEQLQNRIIVFAIAPIEE